MIIRVVLHSANVSHCTVRWDLRACAVSVVAQDHMVLLHSSDWKVQLTEIFIPSLANDDVKENKIQGISDKIDRIFETKSTCHVKQRTTGKFKFPFFTSFLLVLTKFSFWEEDWALGYNSMKFWNFSVISYLPKSFVVRQLVRQLVYTIFVTNNQALFHFWWKENLLKHQKVSKYYEHGCRLIV